ncbi:FecR family protein [Maribellus sediminis]|uniref:FecR family protein n=1 Tax=Maribellus sediminis TaxID=2696285 RepID=UPI001430B60E|nr:FecR domain-containing protein [Maribellus sediminis]
MENIENRNWELVAKHLAGETNTHENLEVEAWLKESEENRKAFEESKKALKKTDAYYRSNRFNTNEAWKNVYAQTARSQGKTVQFKKKRKEAISQFYKYAAVIVLALLLGSVGYYIGFINRVPAIYSEIISADKQVLQEYVLPDGSVVALNSNSKLTFPKKFRGDVREVSIEGEAFFDVIPNAEKPFVINAGDAQVKVLGTSFTVNAYPENKTVEVIVKTGKVQVINKNIEKETNNREVFLTPGEKGTLFTVNHTIEKSVNTDPNFLSWKTHDLVFDNVPLGDVIRCLEKTYHIEIQLSEPELSDLRYEGHFDQKPAKFVLDIIRLTFNLDLTGDEEHFVLASRKN